jgi:hypothetical protein
MLSFNGKKVDIFKLKSRFLSPVVKGTQVVCPNVKNRVCEAQLKKEHHPSKRFLKELQTK